MSKLSRRETLAGGGRAIAVAAVLSTLPSIAHAKEDAELFALFGKCKQLEKEYIKAINGYEKVQIPVSRSFPEMPLYGESRREWEREYRPSLNKALERAGVPALKKKHKATERAWLAAQDRFYDMPAHTPAGMILKLTNEWTEGQRRDWRAKGIAADVEYHPDATSSVLLDIERLAGRAI